jgi:hypothetical protein
LEVKLGSPMQCNYFTKIPGLASDKNEYSGELSRYVFLPSLKADNSS